MGHYLAKVQGVTLTKVRNGQFNVSADNSSAWGTVCYDTQIAPKKTPWVLLQDGRTTSPTFATMSDAVAAFAAEHVTPDFLPDVKDYAVNHMDKGEWSLVVHGLVKDEDLRSLIGQAATITTAVARVSRYLHAA